MSHHEIEDFIEQSIIAIDTSNSDKKRELIEGILALEYFFDTSDISGRFTAILKKYDISNSPHNGDFNAPDFFYKLLSLFKTENKLSLISTAYDIFVTSIIDQDFSKQQDIPTNFIDWLESPNLIKIRELVQDVTDIYENTHLDIDNEIEICKNYNQTAILMFLGKLESPLEEIVTFHKKESLKKHLENPREIIHTYFLNTIGQKIKSSKAHINISKAGYKETEIFFSLGKQVISGEHIYVNLYILLDESEGWISCYIGIQYEEILSWQNKPASNGIKNQHTLHNLIMYLNNEDFTGNKYINSLGVWKYVSTQSEKKLKDTCQNVIDMYQKHHDTILDTQIQRIQYFQKLSSLGDFLKEIQAFEDLMMIPMDKNLPFANRYDIIYYLVFYHNQNGNTLLAKEYSTYIKNLGTESLSENIKKRNTYFVNCLDTNGVFPELLNIKNL